MMISFLLIVLKALKLIENLLSGSKEGQLKVLHRALLFEWRKYYDNLLGQILRVYF